MPSVRCRRQNGPNVSQCAMRPSRRWSILRFHPRLLRQRSSTSSRIWRGQFFETTNNAPPSAAPSPVGALSQDCSNNAARAETYERGLDMAKKRKKAPAKARRILSPPASLGGKISTTTVRLPITNIYLGDDYTGVIYVGSQKKPCNVILDTGSSSLAIDGN